MRYSTISRIQAILRLTGVAQAVAVAKSYGIDTPVAFMVYIIAKPGQSVRIRKD